MKNQVSSYKYSLENFSHALSYDIFLIPCQFYFYVSPVKKLEDTDSFHI